MSERRVRTAAGGKLSGNLDLKIKKGRLAMQTGTIKNIIYKRGFGFIQTGGGDLFFHFTELVDCELDDLKPGDRVAFVIGETRDGRPCARGVARVEAE